LGAEKEEEEEEGEQAAGREKYVLKESIKAKMNIQ